MCGAGRPSVAGTWLAAPAPTPMGAGARPGNRRRAPPDRLTGLRPAKIQSGPNPGLGVRGSGRSRNVRFLNGTKNFTALDLHSPGRINADPHAVSARIEHGDDNVITNQDLFS